MDFRFRGPEFSLVQKYFKPTTRFRAGDKFIDANELGAIL
jgi:hypothetical protein